MNTEIGAVTNGLNVSIATSISTELLLTFFLLVVFYLQVIIPLKKRNEKYLELLSPPNLGLYFFFAAFVGGPISGGCMDFFRSFSSMFFKGVFHNSLIAHVVGPIVATIAFSSFINLWNENPKSESRLLKAVRTCFSVVSMLCCAMCQKRKDKKLEEDDEDEDEYE